MSNVLEIPSNGILITNNGNYPTMISTVDEENPLLKYLDYRWQRSLGGTTRLDWKNYFLLSLLESYTDGSIMVYNNTVSNYKDTYEDASLANLLLLNNQDRVTLSGYLYEYNDNLTANLHNSEPLFINEDNAQVGIYSEGALKGQIAGFRPSAITHNTFKCFSIMLPVSYTVNDYGTWIYKGTLNSQPYLSVKLSGVEGLTSNNVANGSTITQLHLLKTSNSSSTTKIISVPIELGLYGTFYNDYRSEYLIINFTPKSTSDVFIEVAMTNRPTGSSNGVVPLTKGIVDYSNRDTTPFNKEYVYTGGSYCKRTDITLGAETTDDSCLALNNGVVAYIVNSKV